MTRKTRCQAIIVQAGQLLLIQHINHQRGNLYWWLPGGGVEAGETTEDCMLREIREETGLEVRVERLLEEKHDPQRTLGYECYLTYLCTPVGGTLQPGAENSPGHSIRQVAWYPIRDVSRWEAGFYEAHLLPALRLAQAALPAE